MNTPIPELIKPSQPKKIYVPGQSVRAESIEASHIPDGIHRDSLSEIVAKLFEDFAEEQLYDTQQFIKYFQDKRALVQIQVPSLLDLIKNSVCYDANNQIDLRLLIATIIPPDRPLFIDLAKQLSERFVNNPDRPATPLTLMQFKVLLAYRMAQLGF